MDMEIEMKEKDKQRLFADLEGGDCFEHSNNYYLKMRVLISDKYNAVNLCGGTRTKIPWDTLVTPVKAKVVIE